MKLNKITALALAFVLATTTGVSAYAASPEFKDKVDNISILQRFDINEMPIIQEGVQKFEVITLDEATFLDNANFTFTLETFDNGGMPIIQEGLQIIQEGVQKLEVITLDKVIFLNNDNFTFKTFNNGEIPAIP